MSIDERAPVRVQLTAGPHVIAAAFIAAPRRTNPTPAAAVHPQLDGHDATPRASALRYLDRDRTVQCHRPGRHAEPPADLLVPSGERADEDAVRATDHRDARAPRVSRRRDATSTSQRLLRVLRRRPRSAAAASRRGIQKALQRDPGQPEVRASTSSRIRRASRPARSIALSDLELASRLSFFLWSSIPDDELLTWRRRASCSTPAVLDAAGAPHAGRPEGRRARDELRRPVAVSAQPEEHPAELGGVSRLRRQPPPGASSAKPRCSSRASSTKTATCST